MTERTRRPSAEIRAEIESAEARLADIDQRISDAMATIDSLRRESRSLYESQFRYEAGEIPDLKRELASSVKFEEFESGIPVIWSSPPSHYGDTPFAVINVTAKRIRIREGKHLSDQQFCVDGSPPSACLNPPQIDIQATFGVPEITAKLWAEIKGRRTNGQPK